MTAPWTPTGELVAVGWLRSVLSGVDVATTVADPTRWNGDVFVAATVVGGQVDRSAPVRAPVVQLDCYARRSSTSERPAWNRANVCAENIRLATFAAAGLPMDMPVTGYAPVTIYSVVLMTEPHRIVSDPDSLARYTVDIQIVYLVDGETV